MDKGKHQNNFKIRLSYYEIQVFPSFDSVIVTIHENYEIHGNVETQKIVEGI